MAIDPAALVKRYHEALNRYDAMTVGPMFASTATYQSPAVGTLLGRANIIAAFDAYFSEHPGQHSVDMALVTLNPHSARSEWKLQSVSKSTGEPYVREGWETVTFDGEGLIIRVEVEDR